VQRTESALHLLVTGLQRSILLLQLLDLLTGLLRELLNEFNDILAVKAAKHTGLKIRGHRNILPLHTNIYLNLRYHKRQGMTSEKKEEIF
jgi:hypothetical protein